MFSITKSISRLQKDTLIERPKHEKEYVVPSLFRIFTFLVLHPRCTDGYKPRTDEVPSCSSSEAIIEEDEEQDDLKEENTPQQVQWSGVL